MPETHVPPLKNGLNRPFLWLTACLLLALALLVYPVYVIRPFRHQGAAELSAALTVLQIRPFAGWILGFTASAFFVVAWRKTRRILARIGAALLLVATVGLGLLSRINIYELMFHPLERPRFIASAQSKLDAGEQVIAVNVGGRARAYPIRVISYHHIVNDDLAGHPIVATY